MFQFRCQAQLAQQARMDLNENPALSQKLSQNKSLQPKGSKILHKFKSFALSRSFFNQ